MIQLVRRKLLVIIVDEVLEVKICKELDDNGAHGYNAVTVRGKGSVATHQDELEGRSVRIESILSEELALKILELLKAKYFEKYSMIAYLQEVEVVRAERF